MVVRRNPMRTRSNGHYPFCNREWVIVIVRSRQTNVAFAAQKSSLSRLHPPLPRWVGRYTFACPRHVCFSPRQQPRRRRRAISVSGHGRKSPVAYHCPIHRAFACFSDIVSVRRSHSRAVCLVIGSRELAALSEHKWGLRRDNGILQNAHSRHGRVRIYRLSSLRTVAS
jgi:hypothetical protein